MNIPIAFLAALITIESGGNWQTIGDGGKARGGLQIHEATWNEAVSFLYPDGAPVGWGWTSGAHNPEKAKAVCVAYLTHWGQVYEKRTGRSATPEVLARIWNGGPNGWKKKATKPYWEKVKVLTAEANR